MGLFSRNKTKKNTPARRRSTARSTTADSEKPSSLYANQYRRGRTIAASDYMRKNAVNEKLHGEASPREKTRQLNKMRKTLVTASWVIGIGSIVLAGLIASFTANVVISFSGVDSIPDASRYEKSIQEYLSKNPTERFRFNLEDAHLTKYVVAEHPEVSSVVQDGFAGFASSGYTIALRKPVVSWQVGKQQYFVDNDGVSFARNLFSDPRVKIVDNSGVQHSAGTAIASERFLSFVGRSVALAQDNSLTVEKVSIPAGTSRQVELFIKDTPYPFILSIDRSAGEQIEDVLRSIQYFTRVGKSPLYVDVRVKGRAFFREG